MKSFVFAVALLFGVLQLSAQTTAPAALKLGTPAPPLAIAKFMNGDSIARFQKGRIYVVEFWATWCKPCIAGMPHLSEIARKFQKDVTVIGCSILERKGTTAADIEKFVAGMGDKMDYTVAREQDRLMSDRWLHAYGENGIPCAFIVDQEGRVAWLGMPAHLDEILPQVIAGKWNIAAAANQRTEKIRLSYIDGYDVVTMLNPYMGNPGRPVECLKKIDSLLKAEPGLKYYPNTGHFTFYSLLKTDEAKALAFAKAWFAANPDAPRYSTITDATHGDGLSPAMYRFAADVYQAQLDKYPWSMDFKATYKNMAELYRKAGDTKSAEAMEQKAATAPAGFSH